jgi:predicted dehydrogenase
MAVNGSSRVRVGVVGVGAMGERHARTYAQLPEATLVGLYDADPLRAVSVAEQLGCRQFDDLDALFQEVEAVSIVTPTFTHAEVAEQALERGCHLLIEKPLAATIEESRILIEQAADSPELVVLVGHIERFNPTVRALRQILSGQRVVSATIRRMSPFSNRCLDTDVVHDLMIHDIDLLADIFGDQVVEIDAVGSSVQTDKIDQAIAQFSLESGPSVTLVASRVSDRRLRTIEVRTTEAWIVADLLAGSVAITPLSVIGPDGESWPLSEIGNLDTTYVGVPTSQPLTVELQHFLDCVRGRSRPLVDILGGFKAMVYAGKVVEIVEHGAQLPNGSTRLLARSMS